MHLRPRAVIEILNKKRRLYPLVGVLGIRQSGKSTLLRDLVGRQEGLPYFTLDRPEILKAVKAKPESFLRAESNGFEKSIIIDEAQKSPALFDVLKVLADENRKRGMVLLAGSVDFSKAHGVREALTGRIGISRLYPFTLGELRGDATVAEEGAGKKIGLIDKMAGDAKYDASQADRLNREIQTYLLRGGMPTICRIGDAHERGLIINELLDAICYRDLMQLKGARYDGAIARELLSLIARHPTYSKADFAHEMGEDARIIDKHIRGLEALFVLHRVSSYKAGSRDDRFVIWDAAICHYLGGDHKSCFLSLLINQIKAGYEYGGEPEPELAYYSSRGATKIDLVVKPRLAKGGEYVQGPSSPSSVLPIVLVDKDQISSAMQKSLKALIDKALFSKIFVVSPIMQGYSLSEQIKVVPQFIVG